MDWHAAMEDERRMLKRIVALLFWFAWLARLSCALPRSARGYVLGVLRRAETLACGFVVGRALDRGVAPPAFLLIPALQDGDTVADALRLAQTFRMLAALLDSLAAQSFERRRGYAASQASVVTTISRLRTVAGTQQFVPAQTCLAVGRIDSS